MCNEDSSLAVSGRPAEEVSGPALGIVLAAGLLAILIWNLPGLNLLFYPFKLFVTFVHESCHGLAALVTGGWWVNFTVLPDGSGLAYTSGGFRPLVISAGYLGSSVFGALMLVAATRRGTSRALLFLLGGLLTLVTLIYARNVFGFISGLLLAGMLLGVASASTGPLASLLLAFLAVLNCLYALNDLKTLLILSTSPQFAAVATDAQNMAHVTGGVIPPVIWALLWMLMALAILAGALRFIFRRA